MAWRGLVVVAVGWVFPAMPLATHHIPDADGRGAQVAPLPEQTLEFRLLTQAEALQSQQALPAPCTPPDPKVAHARNEQRPLPGREGLSINLGTRLSAYLGTLHSHTAASDGQGSVEEAYRMARDEAHLDFFAVTDHPEYWLFHKARHYEDQKKIAAAAARPGYVPLVGFEYSSLIFGHFTVLNSAHVHHAFEDTSLADFYRWLERPEQREALIMFAHPGFHDYRFPYEFSHFALEPALKEQMIGIEVIHWSEYLRYFRGYFGLIPYIDEAIRQGWWVGAAASQDVHYANWGSRDGSRIGLLMAGLSHEQILAALRSRHFYATNNRNLQFAVNAERRDGTWAMMGDQLNAEALPAATMTVKARYYDGDCEERPYRMEAVLDGNVIATYDYPVVKAGAPFPFAGEFTLQLPLDRGRLPRRFGLYFRFYQGDDHETFSESSPMIIML